MKQDNMPQVARFWNAIASEFDSIYTVANKSDVQRFMCSPLRCPRPLQAGLALVSSAGATGKNTPPGD